MENVYDNKLRRTSVTAKNGVATLRGCAEQKATKETERTRAFVLFVCFGSPPSPRFLLPTANRLHRHTQRMVAPWADVSGIANPTANVTVSEQVASRKAEYSDPLLSVPNGSAAAYPTVAVSSAYGAGQTETGEVYLPQTPEAFTHDVDGNLTADGRWSYPWEGENRLTQMLRDTESPASTRQRLVFEYDHQGWRIRKQFYTSSSGWVEQSDTVFEQDR